MTVVLLQGGYRVGRRSLNQRKKVNSVEKYTSLMKEQ